MSKIAAIQMNSLLSIDDNLKKTVEMVARAADQGARLAVLPEMFACMGDARQQLDSAEALGCGSIQDAVASLAQQHRLWIVAGTIPIATKSAKYRAASLVFDDRGNRVARYDKMHLFDATLSKTEQYRESDTVESGDTLVVIDSPVGKLGVAVCFDLRFPAMFTAMANQGVEVIAVPAAFTVTTGRAHWHLLMRSRAVENLCYTVGACQYGTHNKNRVTYGHSLIVNPWGTVLAEQENADGQIVFADIDLSYLREVRQQLPVQRYQSTELARFL